VSLYPTGSMIPYLGSFSEHSASTTLHYGWIVVESTDGYRTSTLVQLIGNGSDHAGFTARMPAPVCTSQNLL
jgi:hypothetical protein